MARPSGTLGSPWTATTGDAGYPSLDRDLTVDVAVLGGGIAGLTAALLLKREGLTVAVVEADRVGAGVTGHTTAKLSSLHGLTYHSLRSSFGEDGARTYADLNESGIALVRELAGELRIDCDLRTKPAFTYAQHESDVAKVRDEVDAARAAGLRASFTTETGLPFPVAGAIRVEDQAEFHPRRYVLGLAAAVDGDGSAVYEGTRAQDVKDGDPARVETTGRTVTAGHVVVATHIPFLDRGLYFARTHPERSYAILCRIAGTPPQGMYLSTEQPAHTLRSVPLDGDELLLVGGESHKTGQGDGAQSYARLEDFAREHFDVRSVEYRWAAQDNMPIDGVPYVGRLSPLSRRLLTATGFKKWGLAAGTAAGEVLRDAVLGRPNPWAELLDPGRFKPLAAAKSAVVENANVGLHFVGDRLIRGVTRTPADLAPGEGAVVRRGKRRLAAYRDEEGTLHAVSAVCTHLRCLVSWNSGDRTWDCPCHGSRFGLDGEVLHGPATTPLDPA